MEDSDCYASLANLLCQEDGTCLDCQGDEEEVEKEPEYKVLEAEQDDQIGTLVSMESSFESRRDTFSPSDDSSTAIRNWLRRARSDAVRWILKTRACFGFSSETAYLSVTYLDRFFARRTIDGMKAWAIQLLSIACLSLAAKMVECRAPALSEFRMEEFYFDSNQIQRTELLVLNTLEWRMRSITPFPYLNYFASKLICENNPPKDLLSGATQLILSTIQALNSVGHRPSAIACAAIFIASDQGPTRTLLESKIGVIFLCGSLEIEHVISCYNVMIQESRKEKLRMQKLLVSSALSSSTNGDLRCSTDDTSFPTLNSKKRRFL